MQKLPKPSSTTEVYLAAIVDRLDTLIALATPATGPVITINQPPVPAARRRTNHQEPRNG